MKRSRLALLLLLSAGAACCSKQHSQFDAMVPPGASSVSYVKQSDFSEGMTFHVTTEPRSYRYVDEVRAAVRSQGFSLCKKSALQDWTHKPTQDGAAQDEYWLVELYSKNGFERFFVIRVDGTPVDGGARWRQGFLLAAQTVPSGRQDMQSIKEFCD